MICDTVYVFPGCCFLLEEGHQSMIDRSQFANSVFSEIIVGSGWTGLATSYASISIKNLMGFQKKKKKKGKKENIIKKL